MRSGTILMACCAAAFAAGCADVKSSDVKTSGMSASMQVVANGGTSATATASVTVGTDYVELSGGDALTANTTTSPAPIAMSESKLLGIISYAATLGDGAAEGNESRITYNRSGNTSAPNSTCTMPAPFNLTGPSAGATFSRSNQDIVVSWDASGKSSPMQYQAKGDCIDTVQAGTIPADTGTVTIPKGSIHASTSGSNASTSCAITVTVTRSSAGLLDPAFGGGGSISCMQQRSVQVQSAP